MPRLPLTRGKRKRGRKKTLSSLAYPEAEAKTIWIPARPETARRKKTDLHSLEKKKKGKKREGGRDLSRNGRLDLRRKQGLTGEHVYVGEGGKEKGGRKPSCPWLGEGSFRAAQVGMPRREEAIRFSD